MAIVNPSLNIIVKGDGVTNIDIEDTFVLGNKVENTYTINTSDGSTSIDLSNVENLKYLMFDGDDDFNVTLSKDTGDNIITIPCTDGNPMIFPASTTFISSLDGITISTDSETDVVVNVRAYGESA